MKRMFRVTDRVSGQVSAHIEAGNGKAALRKFLRSFTASGFYEIRKDNGLWTLTSSYGSWFTAERA